MSKMAQAAQANNPTCPNGHPVEIVDSDYLLWGYCKVEDRSWRVMSDGTPIPDGHPLGGQARIEEEGFSS